MGFFDSFSSKQKPQPDPTPATPAADKPALAGGVIPRMAEARAKLEARDLPAAVAIYTEVLASAGARPDVLVTLSGELGSRGHVRELIELVAPHYDAQRHGPATGINLLQAFLSLRQIDSAQHLLDILFALNRPELEERLIGFSNALGELMAGHDAAAPTAEQIAGDAPVQNKISLASISKPVWYYGLEAAAPQLLPAKDGKLRRVAFAQCSLPGLSDFAARSARPEDETGRFCRGLALWFAETFTASAGYDASAAVGLSSALHYFLFPVEWTAENIRELNDTSTGGLDYVVTTSLRNRNDDFELTLRIWEVKKFRELKQFSTRWTPATADAVLGQFLAQLRLYMEWTALPEGSGPAYVPPAVPTAHVQALGATLTQFLGGKGVLAPAQVEAGLAVALRNARANPDDVRAQLTLITGLLRQKAQGAELDATARQHALAWLATEAAQKADASALMIKLA
ncbi:hypothetical protein Verru16b_01084 [Lacunisphaera limnophila]|uniref:Tetratricopeptide repeat protein n=1 Tax=Lacunisphaera limnophila TaxID=1838286 RepID=A0A1D8AT01_9BACT|nr:hypothetical protein [Lacunisphaera limnophila]AOS44023.1 hypothetical protein Verru16b_01084 [Lacunisphaera limnophila]